jgi:broad specificity phosphatase PhoE
LRPRWYLHKLKRGFLPDDETIDNMGGRILTVARKLAQENPDSASAIVSHADPIQAAWVLLDKRPHNEVEMYRKAVDRGGMLKVDFEGDEPKHWEYIAPPKVQADVEPKAEEIREKAG